MKRPLKLRSRHAEHGAIVTEDDGIEFVRRYEDGAALEYSAVRTGAGIIERSDLGVARLWGRDPVRMLNGLITNDLSGATEATAVYGAMLTPKGRMITDLRARTHREGEGVEVGFDFPRVAEQPLREHLKKYIPPLFARWEIVETVTTIGVYGPRSQELAERLVGATTRVFEDGVVAGSFGGHPVTGVTTRIAGGGEGIDLFVPDAVADDLWREAVDGGGDRGAKPIGMATLETLRIEAGRPRFGKELTEDSIPAEAYETTGLMSRAVSFTKGCYTGQEVVVRIAHRGHVNRHLRGLALGEGPTPAEGAPLIRVSDGKEVGRITSATNSPLMGQTVALGYLRREVEPGEVVRIGGDEGATGTVLELPFRKPA